MLVIADFVYKRLNSPVLLRNIGSLQRKSLQATALNEALAPADTLDD